MIGNSDCGGYTIHFIVFTRPMLWRLTGIGMGRIGTKINYKRSPMVGM